MTDREDDKQDVSGSPAQARRNASRVDLVIAREMLLARRNGSLFLAIILAGLIAWRGWNESLFLLPVAVALYAAVAQVNLWLIAAELNRRAWED
jgi:hypothetical protein